jgi:hypothetical protein
MRTRRLARLSVIVLGIPFLLAAFGGWATITVEDLPDSLPVGQPADLVFSVRQHGVRLISGLDPEVEARLGRGGRRVEVKAVATVAEGRYRAALALPEAGEWTIVIHSGFGPSRLKLLPVRAGSGPASTAPLTNVERGRRLFVAKGCAMCHINSAIQSEEKPHDVGAPDLTGRTYPAAALAQQLTNPAATAAAQHRENRMPTLGLKPAEIAALTAFINGERAAGGR